MILPEEDLELDWLQAGPQTGQGSILSPPIHSRQSDGYPALSVRKSLPGPLADQRWLVRRSTSYHSQEMVVMIVHVQSLRWIANPI